MCRTFYPVTKHVTTHLCRAANPSQHAEVLSGRHRVGHAGGACEVFSCARTASEQAEAAGRAGHGCDPGQRRRGRADHQAGINGKAARYQKVCASRRHSVCLRRHAHAPAHRAPDPRPHTRSYTTAFAWGRNCGRDEPRARRASGPHDAHRARGHALSTVRGTFWIGVFLSVHAFWQRMVVWSQSCQ